MTEIIIALIIAAITAIIVVPIHKNNSEQKELSHFEKNIPKNNDNLTALLTSCGLFLLIGGAFLLALNSEHKQLNELGNCNFKSSDLSFFGNNKTQRSKNFSNCIIQCCEMCKECSKNCSFLSSYSHHQKNCLTSCSVMHNLCVRRC